MPNIMLLDSRETHDAHIMGFDTPSRHEDDATQCERAQGKRGDGGTWTEYTLRCAGDCVVLSGPEAVAIARAILQDQETLKAAEAAK